MTPYLKTISISLFILFFILSGFYLFFTWSIQMMSHRVQDILSVGNFLVLEETVLKANESVAKPVEKTFQKKANDELKKLFKDNSKVASLDEINSLSLTDREKEALMAGSIVYKNEKNLMFLTYSLHDVYAFKRIGKSDHILKIQIGLSMNDTVKSSTWLMRRLILETLKSTPENRWKDALNRLQTLYQIPLAFTEIDSKDISRAAGKQLMHNDVVYEIPSGDNPISVIYFTVPDSRKIIVLGPLSYPSFSLQFSGIQIYFVIIITFLSILAVVILTWLFIRNSAKIYKLTREYSRGHFDYDLKLNRFSILRGTYENVITMGKQINLLIQSQQNMARFVAHEIRTPLYTIQMAVDSLKRPGADPVENQQHIESIQEDIQQLNKLTADFLLYSQSSTHELKLTRETLNLRQWLENLLKNYPSHAIKLSFAYQTDNELISFDPKLLYHAVTNLIGNALKHASQEIRVSLKYKNKSVVICVEDDGPGVPESDRGKIVEPFTTLNQVDTTGKHIGLGLAIVKSIMALHGGMLLINESKILKGASFCLVFPQETKVG